MAPDLPSLATDRARRYYCAMESASVLGVLSSWEVIAACLVLMLLLPLVFAVASLKSPVRRPVFHRGAAVRRPAGRPAARPGAGAAPRAAEGRATRAAPPAQKPAGSDAEDES
jgi:hypothetical protein